jgi:FlaA1/EpsC-like NDP-sugar epimerase
METGVILQDKRILITGGTGSLGKVLLRRILSGELGRPKKVMVFSRDEAKQHDLRLQFKHRLVATDEIIYKNFDELLAFQIGDVRNFHSVASAVRGMDIVVNAAALKQVPTCEYSPYEAVLTNIAGPENIVRAIEQLRLPVETVVGVSTDKACKPVNVMGMTKAIQERVFLQGNMRCDGTRFIAVRYGNVLASRGSVIPLFLDQIRQGGPVTLTTRKMTRFLLSLNRAVDTIFAALRGAKPGETYIPRVPSARVEDIATVLIGDRPIEIVETGIRPGEKVHEILISEEECHRTAERNEYYAIQPILPELRGPAAPIALNTEYSSAEDALDRARLAELLQSNDLMPSANAGFRAPTELLR